MKQLSIYFTGFLLLLNGCKSRNCHIELVSSKDKTWLIPIESFGAIGFTGDQDHKTVMRSSYKLRHFSDCDGWFGKGNKYEIVEVSFEKESCNSPRCEMRMTLSRNAENKGSKIHLKVFDFSHYISPDQDKQPAHQKLFIPGLKQNVNTWLFKNDKKYAEIVSVNYSKTYGVVAYQTSNGESFVMDSVFARPYFPL